MNFIVVVGALLWIYFLSVFKRGKLDFHFFITGSVGMFIIFMILLQPILTVPLQKGVAAMAGVLGKATGIYESYFRYSMLLISHKGEAISLYIDYECSGVIEIGAYLSLICFFSVYKFHEKIVAGLMGCVYLFVANVLRIYLIGLMIYLFGTSIYYVSHTIIGRIFFYGCSVYLYYYVFTKAQILRQKVGNVSYESDSQIIS